MLSKTKKFHCYSQIICCRRWKHNPAVKTAKKKHAPTEKALEHFDDFYKPLFNKQWPSIRLGLLTERKYIAVLNNYSDLERVQSSLESQGAINVKKLFEVESVKCLKRSKSFEKSKLKRSKELDKTLTEIGENKIEEEHGELYSSSGGSKGSALDQNASSDRYIDPSISVSQLYEYVPATELKGSEDWVRESTHFSYYSPTSDITVKILNDDVLPFPEHLHLYTFEPGNITQFPSPKKGSTGVSDYFLLDGGSCLPVLALDIQPNDIILDMCAAPGGKSLLTLQTLHPKSVVCNDISESRGNRVRRLMREFFYDYDKKMNEGEILITQDDARTIVAPNHYNKILVDVPCTTDRHSVNEDDNNIFKPSRLKERIRIPEIQSQILTAALKLVQVGGTVVYSTCTLSPIQNDGVVHMALKNMAEESNSEIAVVDMTDALEPTRIMYRYANIGLRYGHLVVPYIINNFGPTYFCKLLKIR